MRSRVLASTLVLVPAGALCAALGLTVIVGWHTHNTEILQIRPTWIAMAYNTALCFFLGGVGLLSLVFGRGRAALVCGVVIVVFGSLNLIQYLSGVELGIDELFMEAYDRVQTAHPGRMAPSTGICFVLAGVALLGAGGLVSTRARPLAVATLGSIVAALGAVAFSGYLVGMKTYDWGVLVPMAAHTAIGFSLLGIGLLASAWQVTPEDVAGLPDWLPIPIGVGGVAASLCFWQPLAATRQQQITHEVEAQLMLVRRAVELEVNRRALWLAAGALASQHGSTAGRRGEDQPTHPRFDANRRQVVAWIDASFHVQRIEPDEPGRVREIQALLDQPSLRQHLLRARGSGAPALADVGEPSRVGRTLIVCLPVSSAGSPEGFAVGFSQVSELFATVLAHDVATDFAIVVFEGENELYHQGDVAGSEVASWEREAPVDLQGVNWRVRITLLPAGLARLWSPIAEAVMAMGLLASLMLAWIVRMALRSREHVCLLESANQRLGREVGERARTEDSLQVTAKELERTLSAVRRSVERLSSASAEILGSTTQQASDVQEQATAVAEVVTTIGALARSAGQIAERARAVGQSVRHTVEVGDAGHRAVEGSAQAMTAVRDQLESTTAKIVSLASQAQAIGDIIATVNDIAEQTNVLALNASIEASRAGEHGRSFAVVATEVKSLADQSKRSTVRVRQILEDIQRSTNGVVVATEGVTRGVASAFVASGEAGDVIGTLVETLSKAEQASEQNAAAAGQQALGMTQISQAMQSVDQIAQRNAAAIREIERTAESLRELSEHLAGIVAVAPLKPTRGMTT
jgi:methyl-accepting chemotaxis protein